MATPTALFIGILVALLAVIIIARGLRVLQEYEQGIHIRLGKFIGMLGGGLHWVIPFLDRVVKIDTRTMTIDVPSQDVITKDNAPVRVDGIILARISDAKKTFYQVENHLRAIIALAQTNLRAIIGDMELDQTLRGREQINGKLLMALEKQTSEWGVKVENVEIREVEPSAHVKESMERQSSAERNRRAAILEAEGEKRSAVLRAEGQKEASVLEAQGSKEAKILTAEGEAGSLQLVALGASTLDDRAMALKGLETMEAIGTSPATKIVLPLEVTKAIQGAARSLGIATESPDKLDARMSVGELEKLTGLDLKKIFLDRAQIQAQVEASSKLAQEEAKLAG